MAIGFFIPYLGDNVVSIAVSLLGWVLGPGLAVFVLGIYVPFAETWVRTQCGIVVLSIEMYLYITLQCLRCVTKLASFQRSNVGNTS